MAADQRTFCARAASRCGLRVSANGVLELLEPGGEQIVHQVGGLLGGAAKEPLEHEHAVGQLALVVDLTLVGEKVVAQVHGVGEGIAEHLHWPRRGDGGGHLGVAGVLDQVRRPRRPADLAAHLDVLDRVGDPVGVDVGELPQRFCMTSTRPSPTAYDTRRFTR